MIRTTLIWLLTLLSLQCIAGDWKADWKKATNFYIQKKYDSAARYYEQIATTHPHNAEVYYNLGNTYYRLNRIAPAVLNYERALQTDPGHRDAQDNLAITQARISHLITPADNIFFVKWWRSITSQTQATTWAIVALVAFLLALATWWARRYTTQGSRLPFQLPGILGFVTVCALLLGFIAASNAKDAGKAVIFENDAPLLDAQKGGGKPAALLPEGTTVHIINEAGDWLEVRLPDSRTGWVQTSHVTKV